MTLVTELVTQDNLLAPDLVVLDASGAAAFAIADESHHLRAQGLIATLARQKARLIAPPLFESEVDSILRRRVHMGKMTAEAATAALSLIDALQVEIIQDARVRPRARALAEQLNQVRVYDATYAALAELNNCALWTADERFFNSAHSALNFVRFIGKFALTTNPSA